MKHIITILAVFALLVTSSGAALAAPFKANNNPQIVANYPEGDHGIPGEPFLHQGADVVMRAGNSGIFQQWFYGFSEEEGGITEGDHSVWKPSKDGQYPEKTTAVLAGSDPDNFWGDYLALGTIYCVRTNDFHVSNK